jgi:hypothetical protein
MKEQRKNKEKTNKQVKGLPKRIFRPGTHKNHKFLIFGNSNGDKYKDSDLSK